MAETMAHKVLELMEARVSAIEELGVLVQSLVEGHAGAPAVPACLLRLPGSVPYIAMLFKLLALESFLQFPGISRVRVRVSRVWGRAAVLEDVDELSWRHFRE